MKYSKEHTKEQRQTIYEKLHKELAPIFRRYCGELECCNKYCDGGLDAMPCLDIVYDEIVGVDKGMTWTRRGNDERM